jgi:hypothetical protein
MAGEAKTTDFMLGTATVMIGNPEDLYKLNPEQHSVGLVKNFTIEATKERSDLTQGRTNDVVFTLTTGATTRGTFEMYEYTEKNLAYALGLDGGELVSPEGDAHVVKTSASFSAGSVTLALNDGTGQDIEVGSWVSVRDPISENIVLGTVKTTSGLTDGTAATATIEVEVPDSTMAWEVPAGAYVSLVTVLDVGSTDVDRDFAAKVQGQLANGKWITLLIPKMRVSSGLTMAFGTDNFGNTPFEFTPLKVTPSDTYYAPFKGTSGKLVHDSVQSALS